MALFLRLKARPAKPGQPARVAVVRLDDRRHTLASVQTLIDSAIEMRAALTLRRKNGTPLVVRPSELGALGLSTDADEAVT